jgi:hypothetical protein
MVYSPANRHVMSEITTSVQPTQPNQPRVYGSTAEEAVKYPGRLAFDPLFVPKKKEESMLAAVMLCKIKKGIQGFAKKVSNSMSCKKQ